MKQEALVGLYHFLYKMANLVRNLGNMKKAVYTRLCCNLCNWQTVNEYPFEMTNEEVLQKDKPILTAHMKTHEIDEELKMEHIAHERIKLK